MTIDERLEFLLKSNESLHETAALHSAQIADLIRLAKIDGENIKRLANIPAAHDQRLSDLENDKP